MTWLKDARLAIIVSQQDGEIIFSVDDVTPCEELLSKAPAQELVAKTQENELLAVSHEGKDLVSEVTSNPLVAAVHLAFSQHWPLELRPDDIWLTLAQGFARHINLNAEAFRDRFVRHDGQKSLVVQQKSLENPKEEWSWIVNEFASILDDQLGPGLPRLMKCDFTTTTAESLVASQIALLDAFQKYFDYVLVGICGIPKITLRGTPDDWSAIRDRVHVMAEHDLKWWTRRLLPICDELIATAEGQPKLKFWKHIYKPKEAYGGEVITGWIADLFPYLCDSSSTVAEHRNPLLSIPRSKIIRQKKSPSSSDIDGISSEQVPLGLSEAPVRLIEPDGERLIRVVGGFIGVDQDESTGTLRPEIGWLVTPKSSFDKLLDQLRPHHSPASPPDGQKTALLSFPAELIQFDRRLGRGTLWSERERPWRIFSESEYKPLRAHKGERSISVTQFGELDDGRALCCTGIHLKDWLFDWWVLIGEPEPDEDAPRIYSGMLHDTSVLVISKGINGWVQAMLDADGAYFFDEPGFVSPATLQDLLDSEYRGDF